MILCFQVPSGFILEMRANRLIGNFAAPRAPANSSGESNTSAHPFSTMWSRSSRQTIGSSSADL
eukprot:10110840-Alexandrium_andersonii.AAC.1